MAFTLTSPNKTVAIVSPSAFFEGQIGSAEGIFVYLNYTKGAEGGIKMSILSMDKNVDSTNYFMHVKADANYALSQLFFSLAASARVRVPITLAPGDGKIKLLFETLSGAALDGSMEVDVRCG